MLLVAVKTIESSYLVSLSLRFCALDERVDPLIAEVPFYSDTL